MVSLKFDSGKNILYVEFTGEIRLQDISEYLRDLGKMKDLPDCLDIIHDLTKADYRLRPEQISEVFRLIATQLTKHSRIRVASIHENPHSTAISTIIRERNAFKNVEYRVYSTFEAGENWLGIKENDLTG